MHHEIKVSLNFPAWQSDELARLFRHAVLKAAPSCLSR